MRAYLGLGSNLGDREANIEGALRRLALSSRVKVLKVSSMIDTEPVGGPAQPNYLNAACKVETALRARELLREALRIEKEMGRVRDVRWGPRVIDIDLLLYDTEVISEADLTVPHPRIAERRFVLGPLAEIAPGLRHPVTGKTAREMLSDLAAQECAARTQKSVIRTQKDATKAKRK